MVRSHVGCSHQMKRSAFGLLDEPVLLLPRQAKYYLEMNVSPPQTQVHAWHTLLGYHRPEEPVPA